MIELNTRHLADRNENFVPVSRLFSLLADIYVAIRTIRPINYPTHFSARHCAAARLKKLVAVVEDASYSKTCMFKLISTLG